MLKIAVPAKYFERPPYKAVLLDDRKLLPENEHKRSLVAGVVNIDGLNVLTFSNDPGVVTTTFSHALSIAEDWNSGIDDNHVGPDEILDLKSKLRDAERRLESQAYLIDMYRLLGAKVDGQIGVQFSSLAKTYDGSTSGYCVDDK